ncbi:hypothetical protein AN4341.2 [Aspergillus nidulans FGSC A4]|uniref:Protein prenyltransferase n=1 Tax=Emericella nidulans (strain FGSC A4 / ATCC 38163 / CBS 112.46 / NRRL 194 / M139) TaxID=227321 RepID=Q5B539_EMENI|nr:hypothetical protein [Aspergillus nidulans FGSC A4]EAA60502.1 hypothetical protein AN4341.2 [Aspergillus nidulans FGSC A4]CBF77724.1 TPA: conserved hypothetical protein [Aspergillus nidulans FGSC A4]|eukprot:XP_661945.1 hypothetical protein AN4341.2 [Aspergillus nidulans FGSC A4]
MTAQCPQQPNAFQELFRIFANRDGRVLEFEILPPAFGPILEDGCSIGITKKCLVQAFVVARRIFLNSLMAKSSSQYTDEAASTPVLEGEGGEADQRLTIASEIILLFDCEHLTACNWRKRRLSALFTSDLETLIHALDTELSLMTTYLCSPLHRHTKSPTLWQHRQWAQTHLVRLRKPDFKGVEDLFQAELSVVLRAGELHPRNYYAFTYLRQIHRILAESGGLKSEEWRVQFGQSIIRPTLDWCLVHPADISGLMFLLYLLDGVPITALRLDTVGKVAQFALDIGWEGESIWTFVELATRKFNLLEPLGQSPPYPWAVLRTASLEAMHVEIKARISWRTWLERARIYWAAEKTPTI